MSLKIVNHEFRHFVSTCVRRRYYTVVHFAVCLCRWCQSHTS